MFTLVGVHVSTGEAHRIEHETNTSGVTLSPDNTQLLFQSRGDLYLVQADNHITRLYTQDDTFILGAAWRPR